jgi:hypothetical protein
MSFSDYHFQSHLTFKSKKLIKKLKQTTQP